MAVSKPSCHHSTGFSILKMHSRIFFYRKLASFLCLKMYVLSPCLKTTTTRITQGNWIREDGKGGRRWWCGDQGGLNQVRPDFCCVSWQHCHTPRNPSRAMKEIVKDVSKVKQLILCGTCNKNPCLLRTTAWGSWFLGVLCYRAKLLTHRFTSLPGPAEGFYKEDWTQSFKGYLSIF